MRKYSFWNDLSFYTLTEAYAKVIVLAAGEIQALHDRPAQSAERLEALAELRKKADGTYEEFLKRLNDAFLPPLDKEDLMELFQTEEMLLDAIERAASGLTFAIAGGTHLSALVFKVQDCALAVLDLASSLRQNQHRTLPVNVAVLHRIKREGNALHFAALKDLGADAGNNPQAALYTKEAYDRMLGIFEKSDDLALLLEKFLVKYS